MTDRDKREGAGVDEGVTRYRMMLPILMPPQMRGMYLKPLEKVSPDAKVPFLRIVVSMAVIGGAVIGYLAFVLDGSAPGRAGYVWLPALLVAAAVVVMAVVFLVSSRSKSMLANVFELNRFRLTETAVERRPHALDTVGVQGIDANGVYFDDGDVGAVFEVRGQLSQSTLPEVADSIAEARLNYLKTRTATSQEIRITTVEPNDFAGQRESLRAIAEGLAHAPSQADRWRSTMAAAQEQFLDLLVSQAGRSDQLTIRQTVIVRDVDPATLETSVGNFERAVVQGTYERSTRLADARSIEASLAGVTMLDRHRTRPLLGTVPDEKTD